MTSLEDQLIHAIRLNDIPAASSLIKKGVKVSNSTSPLLYTASRDRVEIMEMLLDAGAEIDAGNPVENTACYAAIANNSFAALQLLVERGAKINGALLQAAAEYAFDDKIILLLLDAGAPLDNLTNDQLMDLVAKPASVAVLERLLARNVDVRELIGAYGYTLCHKVTGDDDVDELIRALGDNVVDSVDFNLSTPLHVAAAANNKSSSRVLVELGAEIDRQDDQGRTALHIAGALPRETSSTFTDLLLALGANVHLTNTVGETASHFAASKPHHANLCACLAAGCDLDQPDNNGNTVRSIARRNRFALPTSDKIEEARRRIAKTRLDLVRERASHICIGLQPLNLNALELCEIMMNSFGALGSLISFHQWWAIATTIKHFHTKR